MKTIIAGSRSEKRYGHLVSAVLTAMNAGIMPISEVVSGCADGVDQMGETWARCYGVPVKSFEPNYPLYGRRHAPKQRNLQMAVYADALIAIWDGKSPGTRHMIATAERMGLKVFVYRTDLEHP